MLDVLCWWVTMLSAHYITLSDLLVLCVRKPFQSNYGTKTKHLSWVAKRRIWRNQVSKARLKDVLSLPTMWFLVGKVKVDLLASKADNPLFWYAIVLRADSRKQCEYWHQTYDSNIRVIMLYCMFCAGGPPYGWSIYKVWFIIFMSDKASLKQAQNKNKANVLGLGYDLKRQV